MNWYKKALDLSNVEGFLEGMREMQNKLGDKGYKYEGVEDFFLKHGKHFVSQPMTEE